MITRRTFNILFPLMTIISFQIVNAFAATGIVKPIRIDNEIILGNSLVNAINQGGDIVLKGCHIKDNFIYHDSILGELQAINCTFDNKVELSKMTNLKYIHFKNCVFMGSLIMNDVHFDEKVFFDSVIFKEKVLFTNSRVEKGITFQGCTFEDTVKCDKTQFVGSGSFNEHSNQDMPGISASFSRSIFKAPAYFTNHICSCFVQFAYSTFQELVTFENSIFYSETSFMNTKFENLACFGNTEFWGQTNFVGAQFMGSQLSTKGSGYFNGTKLLYVLFLGTDLSGMTFTPDTIGEYTMISLADAKGLSNLKRTSNPMPLVKLKLFFRGNFLRQQEREITCALNRHKQSKIQRYLFDIPFAYGASLSRPFAIVLILFLFYSLLYYLLLRIFKFGGRLFILKDIITEYGEISKKYTSINEMVRELKTRNILSIGRFREEIKIILLILGFGIISTFNVGFREVDFARWLRLLWTYKTDFKADGLIRLFSGTQSILSVLLMAFGLLFHYGRFFD